MSDQLEHDAEDCGCAEYRALSRRQFLGTAAGVSGAAVAGAYFPAWVPKVVLAENYVANRDIIVSIFQRGGADGLSLVVPFADANYYAARTNIAIPRPDSGLATKGIALDNFFCFPQAMSGLVPAYMAGHLVAVHAAGSLNTSRSHFDAQRYMEVGKPADPNIVTGWLGRHLASMPPVRSDAPLRALGIASGLQKTLVGAPKTLPIANPGSFSVGSIANNTSTQPQRLSFLSGDYANESEPLHASALDALSTVTLLQSLNINGYVASNGAVYPNSSFGRGLKSIAALIKGNIGIEAAQLDIGGWDTHASQDPIAGSMYNTMRDFSNSLAAFYADVIALNANVIVISISEFGRNVRQNGSLGTDHGRASVFFGMGQGINGGQVIANWPGIGAGQLENNQDLRVTTDHRDLLSEIVQNRLGNTNLSFVFPGWNPSFKGITRT